jgi:hypothetical protein
LFCRGRNHPLQGIVEAGVAHGELQEILETRCRDILALDGKYGILPSFNREALII